MGHPNNPYKLNWHFWSRLLFRNTLAAAACTALFACFLDGPFTLSNFTAAFILVTLMYLGPELSTHYRKSPEQLTRK
ncbi:MAG: hypothetical protein JST93_12040 [Acidobacteria bacterium]|nr:hypothetical protein [Acidobacteriota bacterium]